MVIGVTLFFITGCAGTCETIGDVRYLDTPGIGFAGHSIVDPMVVTEECREGYWRQK